MTDKRRMNSLTLVFWHCLICSPFLAPSLSRQQTYLELDLLLLKTDYAFIASPELRVENSTMVRLVGSIRPSRMRFTILGRL
jgi:hypothetical protein